MSTKKKVTKKKAPKKKKELAGEKMAKAKTLIQEAEQKSTKECWNELSKILKKHGCKFVARPVFTEIGDGTFAISAEPGIAVIKE